MIDDSNATEAPAAEAVAEEGLSAYNARRSIDTDQLREILDRTDRNYREEAARKAAARGRQDSLFKWEPAKIDFPAPPKASGPPIPASQTRQGAAMGTAGPPDRSWNWTGIGTNLLIAAAVIIPLAIWADQSENGIRRRAINAASKLGTWRRRNAALLIVVGLAIVAAAFTVLKPANLPYEYRDYVRDGWFAFGGIALALIGFYDKLRASQSSEI